MQAARSGVSYHFEPFVLDTSRRELLKHGTRIRLRGRSYLLLEVLLARAGEIVTREELQRKLWPADTFVDFEHGLNTSVKNVRQALCDSAGAPRYIETIPRLGYRFIVPVETVEISQASLESASAASQDAASVPAHKVSPLLSLMSRHRRVAVVSSIALGAVLALGLTIVPILVHLASSHSTAKSGGSAKRFVSIAVLPLENLSNDRTQDYFADGMTDELITDLSRLGSLRVISRTSAMRYKGGKKTVAQIGKELAVDGVIEGTVERLGDRVRIRVQLIDAANDRNVWAGSYDREMSDVSLLQGTLARDITKEILGEAAAANDYPHAANMRTVPPEAYDAYLKGRYFWNKRTAQGFQQAIEYFQQAIAKYPDYAQAYAGLADSYAMISSYDFTAQRELMPKARAAAVKALEINDKLAEAHTSLAVITQDHDWDWQTSEREFRQAIDTDPNYATAHHWYAEHLALEGRFDEAFAEMGRARELDPLSLIIAADNGAILYFARQYDRAIEQLRTVLDMEPDFPRAHIVLGAYIEEGRFADALADIESWRRFEDSPWARAMQVYIYARSGDEARADNALNQLRLMNRQRAIDPIDLVFAYAGLNNKDQAFAWLQIACSQHSPGLTALKVDPLYDPLRSDPRFKGALRRVGLAE